MKRMDIINAIIKARGYGRYLEIGVQHGKCFRFVECEEKVGVDPEPYYEVGVMRVTSDEFFQWYTGPQFDIVFVDGMHHEAQVLRDVENSLRILSPGGVVICHDTLPTSEIMQRVPRCVDDWTGDVWKAMYRLRSDRMDVRLFTLDTDYGVTVIERGEPEPLEPRADLDYQFFLDHGRDFLNVRDVGHLQVWLSQGQG